MATPLDPPSHLSYAPAYILIIWSYYTVQRKYCTDKYKKIHKRVQILTKSSVWSQPDLHLVGGEINISLLGAFTKFLNLTVGFIMCACLSAWNNVAPAGWTFMKSDN